MRLWHELQAPSADSAAQCTVAGKLRHENYHMTPTQILRPFALRRLDSSLPIFAEIFLKGKINMYFWHVFNAYFLFTIYFISYQKQAAPFLSNATEINNGACLFYLIRKTQGILNRNNHSMCLQYQVSSRLFWERNETSELSVVELCSITFAFVRQKCSDALFANLYIIW